ncbi:MAG: hypothetical protein JWN93_3587 [Hyphomicrobiales bacterium]|nr:hypothetical protein [Hyphomicrobiales bacterium]
MKFLRTLVVVLMAGAAGAPAFAQAPAPAPAAPAPAPVISASHLDAAREVVVLSGIGRTFNAIVPQLADQTVVTITRTRPEVRTDLIAVLTALLPEFEKRNAEMIDSTARAFAGVMTEQALKDTAAFFKTDAGKQYVQMQPRVIDQMVVSLEAFNRQMSTDLVERVRVEMRKKGHNI